jgi:hypothetical protein
VMDASIGESSGIPNTKNSLPGVEIAFVPLFTGQVFFMPGGLHSGDSREATGREVWHARGPVVERRDKRQGEGRFHRHSIPFLAFLLALPGS